jgi:hypothetical protein
MAFQTLPQTKIAGMTRGGFGLYHNVQCRQSGTLLPEAFADGTLDPVASDRASNGFLGNRNPQPGDGFRAQSIDIETGIRETESLAEGSGELRRDVQPGLGWKPDAGLA